MLIRFAVSNYRSFKEQQIFSMAAGKHTRLKNHIVEINGKRVLKGGVLFGANASGKTNLVRAMNFSKNIIFNGVKENSTYKRYFRIDKDAVKQPGVFQYDFENNGHIYSYGFALSYLNNKIISEWLYLCDDDKEKRIFERTEYGLIESDYKFNDKDNKQRFDIYSKDVTDDKTFLAEIVSHKLRNIEDFKAYYDAADWFRNLIIIFPQTQIGDPSSLLMSDTFDSLGRMLNYFDTGINDIQGKEKSMEDMLSFLPDDLKKQVMNDVQRGFEQEKETKHPEAVEISIVGRRISFAKNEQGEIIATQLLSSHGNEDDLFEIADESDGTKRLFDLIPLYRKGRQNRVIVVDELDRSFHTKLTMEFIEKFYEKTQGYKSQLIVTLHDSNVMNLKLLRQDEIWFVERQDDHSSQLYSLSKFKERFDHAVAKEYLLGKYGAVPNFGVENWYEEED